MGILSVNAGWPSGGYEPQKGAGADAKIQALEQKLTQLGREREEAISRRDEKKKRELERQIEKIERQLEQLKQQEKKEKEIAPEASRQPETVLRPSDVGNYIDTCG